MPQTVIIATGTRPRTTAFAPDGRALQQGAHEGRAGVADGRRPPPFAGKCSPVNRI
ncbi:hypothetical protein [Streptomyces sp. 1222.5]|uniref:hypothetical protein n=1 Tax=Streptomyces sp. 1222.5 TaxID=1881026 RepID=UPI003EC10BB0